MKDFQSFCIPLKISLLLGNVYVIYAQYSYFNWVISWNLNMWLFPPGFFPFSFKLVTVLLPHFRKIKDVSFSKIKPLEELQIKQQIPCSIWISDKWQIIFTISISHAKIWNIFIFKIYSLFIWNLTVYPLLLIAESGNPILGKTWIVYGGSKRYRETHTKGKAS